MAIQKTERVRLGKFFSFEKLEKNGKTGIKLKATGPKFKIMCPHLWAAHKLCNITIFYFFNTIYIIHGIQSLLSLSTLTSNECIARNGKIPERSDMSEYMKAWNKGSVY